MAARSFSRSDVERRTLEGSRWSISVAASSSRCARSINACALASFVAHPGVDPFTAVIGEIIRCYRGS